MKLLRYGPSNQEQPALLGPDGELRKLSAIVGDLAGDVLTPESLKRLRRLHHEDLPRVEGSPRIGPCVGRVGKFICVGLNYSDHAAEAAMPIPTEPILFMKATSAISGPYDDIVIPRGSQKTDWEVELGVIVGKTAKDVTEREAPEHVAGYCVLNDISERSFQLEGTGQWTKGKSADTFGPMGPWLVTSDEIPDPQSLRLWLEVDGRTYQDSNTKMMSFSVAYLVSYVSKFMSLQPGDVIATGTPPGIGMAQRPPKYLQSGNRIRLGIEGLGEQNLLVKGSDEGNME